MDDMRDNIFRFGKKNMWTIAAFTAAVLCTTILFAAGADEELMNKAKSTFGPLPASMPSADGLFRPYEMYTKSQPIDEGRFAVTKNPSDKYVFKVPILRNVAETPPYFHDGSVDKLEDAVMIMAKIQLGKDLIKEQTREIAAFLKSLTGTIPEAALKVPLLPSAD